MTGEPRTPRPLNDRRITVAVIVGLVAAGMAGMAYAAVPLYKIFCQQTGFAGTPRRSELAATHLGARSFTIRFDTNVASDLPWSFVPETPSVDVRSGKTMTVFFKVINTSDRPTVAQASYNVSPDVAGEYFVKLACFCFTAQHLAPGETAEWPVVFYLDPALEKDETMKAVDEMTLSYTMFSVKPLEKPVAEARPRDGARL